MGMSLVCWPVLKRLDFEPFCIEFEDASCVSVVLSNLLTRIVAYPA